MRIEEVSVRKRKNTPSERGGGRREEKGNEGESSGGREEEEGKTEEVANNKERIAWQTSLITPGCQTKVRPQREVSLRGTQMQRGGKGSERVYFFRRMGD